jgi:hypothetical protein
MTSIEKQLSRAFHLEITDESIGWWKERIHPRIVELVTQNEAMIIENTRYKIGTKCPELQKDFGPGISRLVVAVIDQHGHGLCVMCAEPSEELYDLDQLLEAFPEQALPLIAFFHSSPKKGGRE